VPVHIGRKNQMFALPSAEETPTSAADVRSASGRHADGHGSRFDADDLEDDR
jgi:hypothetical protein